jgi:uncharacterized membrane protein
LARQGSPSKGFDPSVVRQAEAIVQVTRSEYAGPMPSPQMMGEYAAHIPDAPERIMRVFEEQSAHRRKMEDLVLTGDVSRSWWGLAAAFVIAMTMTVGGITVAIMVDPPSGPTAGAAMVGTTLVGLCSVFVYGTQSRRSEREGKARTLVARKR